jgi:hypothetical protein
MRHSLFQQFSSAELRAVVMISTFFVQGCRTEPPPIVIPDGSYIPANGKEKIEVSGGEMMFERPGHLRTLHSFQVEPDSTIRFTMSPDHAMKGVADYYWKWVPPAIERSGKTGTRDTVQYLRAP